MSSTSSKVVPAAGIALGTFLVLYLAQDAFTKVKILPCATRYPSATEFTLKANNNAPLSAIELQARAGLDDWGILENASVTPFKDAPSPLVLQVRLPKDSTSLYEAEGNGGGLTFRWQPRGMTNAVSACLSYSVYVPPGFDFGKGGELPGLFGGQTYQAAMPADGINGFASRPKWGINGRTDLSVQAANVKSGTVNPLSGGGFLLPRERWVLIEQETVLNTPGKSDGSARIWVDGTLKSERTKISFRKDKTLTLGGLINDVWYGGLGSKATAPADTFLAFTPPSLSWR